MRVDHEGDTHGLAVPTQQPQDVRAPAQVGAHHDHLAAMEASRTLGIMAYQQQAVVPHVETSEVVRSKWGPGQTDIPRKKPSRTRQETEHGPPSGNICGDIHLLLVLVAFVIIYLMWAGRYEIAIGELGGVAGLAASISGFWFGSRRSPGDVSAAGGRASG